jgi:hypothetical protein
MLQLAMAKRWKDILGMNAAAWGVPPGEVSTFTGLISVAEDCLAQAQSSDRSAVSTAQCKVAFDELAEKMRFIKKHYFLKPPLTDTDLVSLLLAPGDSSRAEIPTPVDIPGVEIIKWAPHILGFRWFVAVNLGGEVSNHGIRFYYGLVEPNVAVSADKITMTELAEKVFLLSSPPRQASELPNSFFTRRTKDTLRLPLAASGKVCYMAAAFETASGKSGDLGAMISTIVP